MGILYIVVVVLLIVGQWKMFEKAGEEGWKSIIPLLNGYTLFKIAWGNGWLFLLGLIPFVNFVIVVMMAVKLARSFGKSGGFAVGLIFLSPIFLLILGFDGSEYIGPNGERPVNRIEYTA